LRNQKNSHSKKKRDLTRLIFIWNDYKSGLSILENLINGILALVEIEQADRDRAFQAIVGIAGVGLGRGGIVTSATANYVTEIKTTPILGDIVEEWSNLNVVLTFSILSGLF